uniref:Transposase (putative) YhgA-like domain-containing protein n=1 Tax=Candidatus Kentrum sp. LPFa TaxID=2126335 RepID=A0A450XXJ7_9GAMM|nr:MAG: conserved hypothetical protein (putative transposase or invertase) [Candidatus Kentron sp. LPFa]VFK34019.1 MAG: conserved hypothetical protein (putative transposase or invertase) [Candidatus Kentron sp. LPFa]
MAKKPGRKIITFDWAIKTVLRDKANFDVLEGFLSALLLRPITILDMLEGESNQRDDADKYNRVDLLAKTGDGAKKDGELIIVEVQYLPEKAYLKRLAYGTSKTIVEHLKLGEPYDKVKKVYSVSLVYFDVSREYYLLAVKRFPDIVRDDLDEWIYAFKNNEVPDEFSAPGINALKDKFDYLKMIEIERRKFDAHLDVTRSAWGTITHAREEGIEEGIQMGREEGMKQGAHERSLEIARALKQSGMSSAQIAEIAGISLSELEKL